MVLKEILKKYSIDIDNVKYIEYYNDDDDENICSFCLSKDTPITVKGNKYLARGGSLIYFYENESIYSFFLKEDTPITVKGKEYLAASDSLIYFYKNESIKEFWLSKDTIITVKGKDYLARGDSLIYFHENGSIKKFFDKNLHKYIKFNEKGEKILDI
jgi:hypothetical protein